MHEAQKAQHETDEKLSNLKKTSSQVKIELNDVLQQNKILQKEVEEARNQLNQSTPTSPILSPTPSLTPSQTPQPDLNKTIKGHDVTIETISERHRSGL